MTIVGLHDFVKVSNSASLKSILLIMCIVALELTTNSRSSSLRVDASKHLFSESEKNVALSCSFKLHTLLASFHAASRAPCSCHYPQILERWGCADEVHLGKYPSEGLWSQILMWRAIAFVNFTSSIYFNMSELFSKIDFGGFMSWQIQPKCRAFDDRRPTGPCFNSW